MTPYSSVSMTLTYHLNQVFLRGDPKYTMSFGFFAYLALNCWQKPLKIAVTIHEETEEELDEDLLDAMTDGDLHSLSDQ